MQDVAMTIRHHLVRYLDGETSLDTFTGWLVGVTWDIETAGNAEARELAYSIELALAETSSGLLTVDELHADLRGLIAYAPVT